MLYSVNKNDNNADNFTDPHNAYTFSGTQWDEETSLNYYGSRYYDSWNGTWSTQDIYRGMIEDPQSLHRTAFVDNNPINFIDPDGFDGVRLSQRNNYSAPNTNDSTLGEQVINSALILTKVYDINADIQVNGLEYSYYNSQTNRVEQSTLDFSFKLEGGELSSSLDINQAWRQGDDYGSAMLDVDAFMTLDQDERLAYILSLGYAEQIDGEITEQIYMDIGNEMGWKLSGKGSSEQNRKLFELSVKARLDAADQKLKTEANQIVVQSMIRQANIAADPWIELMKELWLASSDPSLLDHASAYSNGVKEGFDSDVDTVVNWRDTLSGIGQMFVLLNNLKTEMDLKTLYTMSGGNPEVGKELAQLQAKNDAQIDAIIEGFKKEFADCIAGGQSSDKCAGLITYSAMGGIFLKGLKVAGYLDEAGDMVKLVDGNTNLLNPGIKISDESLQHVIDGHVRTDIYPNKSKFYPDEDIESLILGATHQSRTYQTHGTYITTYDVGRDIGFDAKTGTSTSLVSVVTDAEGNLITAFPGK